MSADLEAIPLFPSHTVVFPYSQVQIHVSEERHRRMVRDCLEYDNPFGIVLIRSDPVNGGHADPYMVGTAGRILQVQDLDGGALEVHVQGERRFRIRRLDESKPYLVGHVEPLVEMELEDTPRTDALVMKAREGFKELIEGMIARQDFSVEIRVGDPVVLSFVIANYIQMEDLQKQRLLETTDTTERLATLIPMLETQARTAQHTSYYRLDRAQLADWINPN